MADENRSRALRQVGHCRINVSLTAESNDILHANRRQHCDRAYLLRRRIALLIKKSRYALLRLEIEQPHVI